jgi:hypothetical protein
MTSLQSRPPDNVEIAVAASASHDADEESIQEELEASVCKFACTGGGWGSYRPAGEDNGPL